MHINLLFAQKRCGTSDLETKQYAINPKLKLQRTSLERNLQTQIQQKQLTADWGEKDILTIPVVFHVLYKNENENLPKINLESQVKVLNQDFRRKNSDTTNVWPQAADSKIRFCLSNVDRNGNYFNGITRTPTDIEFFEYKTDSMFLSAKGGKDIWPGYLNIYVCDLGIDTVGVAAFSSLPGYDAYIDGVVIDYRVTGSFECEGVFGEIFSLDYIFGRTATHEVGHWLNLQHIWGPAENEEDYFCEEDDGVEDTPLSLHPYFACDTGFTCGSKNMTENFMDYHYDYCINLFTEGQTERMRTSIELAPSRSFLKDDCCENCTKQTIKYPLTAEKEGLNAIDTVCASNIISNKAEATYTAGKIVILESGFSVDSTSIFYAGINTID